MVTDNNSSTNHPQVKLTAVQRRALDYLATSNDYHPVNGGQKARFTRLANRGLCEIMDFAGGWFTARITASGRAALKAAK